ncbi:hypothetical protein ABFS82_04G162900 [Erythranthe guttata]
MIFLEVLMKGSSSILMGSLILFMVSLTDFARVGDGTTSNTRRLFVPPGNNFYFSSSHFDLVASLLFIFFFLQLFIPSFFSLESVKLHSFVVIFLTFRKFKYMFCARPTFVFVLF